MILAYIESFWIRQVTDVERMHIDKYSTLVCGGVQDLWQK